MNGLSPDGPIAGTAAEAGIGSLGPAEDNEERMRNMLLGAGALGGGNAG